MKAASRGHLVRAGLLYARREARVAAWRLRWRQREGTVIQRPRSLNGEEICLRVRGSDARVAWDTFYGRYHLPPADLAAGQARLIVDLGSNIGLTVADLAVRFPHARVLGVEPDPATAALARRNISPWKNQVDLVEAAAWIADGPVALYVSEGQEWGARIDPGGSRRVMGITLDTLFERAGAARVDYLKMDIEGAESELLKAPAKWPEFVERLKVEVHPPYTVRACTDDLRALGFRTVLDHRHWACVIGWRTD